MITIKVPATTANLGTGFDTVGLALQLHLEIDMHKHAAQEPAIQIEYQGQGASTLSCDPAKNLIIQSVLHILHRLRHGGHGEVHLPAYTDLSLLGNQSISLRVRNPIPLSRGLGSSASAIVAGAFIAKHIAESNATAADLLDWVLEIENHPDNVSASVYGGLTVSYLRSPSERRLDPRSCYTLTHKLDARIRAVCAVPDFELSTAAARQVLPASYSRQECVYALQRLSSLVCYLTQSAVDPMRVWECMQDRLHQPYRLGLVPGLERVLAEVRPDNIHGVLGVALSGAGPTVLALCVSEYEEVGRRIQQVFLEAGVKSEVKVLEICNDGVVVVQEKDGGNGFQKVGVEE